MTRRDGIGPRAMRGARRWILAAWRAESRTLLPAWLGILVLSFAWFRGLYVFTPPTYDFGTWFAAGVVLVVIGCRNFGPGPRRLSGIEVMLVAVAAVAGIALLPRPHDVGPWLLAASAVLAAVPVPAALRRALLPGLWTAGVVLVLQAALLPLLFIVASRFHEVPSLAPFFYFPLRLVAPETIRAGGALHLATEVDYTVLTPSWEKLGLLPGALAAIAGTTLLLLHRRGATRLPSFFAILMLYGWARLLMLSLVVSRFRKPDVFWDVDLMFVGFLPLAFVLAAWWDPGSAAAAPRTEDAARGFSWRLAAGAAMLASGCTLFWGWQDAGARKPGRVLIDEAHSDWEWTTEVFDKEWYGGRSGYNYYCLADYWSHFYHVETSREPLTPERLAAWDVLVIKTPTAPFAAVEVGAIVEFVRRGGGLFLIGDHTNVFGSATFLNTLAERFGLYFRYDATYTLDYLNLSLYRPPARLRHAVVQHMPDFLFATSCSMNSPLLSENVILGYGLRSMYLDYSETSYFPTKEGKMDYLFPLVVQAGGVRFGKGRVLGFTDSTTFSNFFMFIPGKPELALGSIEWLNRSNRHGPLRRLWLVAAVAGLGLVLWDLRRLPRTAFYSTLLAAGFVSFGLAAAWCERAAARSYPPPRSLRPPEEVVFDGEHGGFLLPTHSLVAEHWTNMHTFFVWTQRLGLVPGYETDLTAALRRRPRVLVEVNPRREYELEDIDAVVEFVHRGGTLLVMDTPENESTMSNQLLGAFAMAFTAHAADSMAVLTAESGPADWLVGRTAGDTLGIPPRAFGVTGAEPLLVLGDGVPVMGVRDFGKGKVVAFGASRLFSNESMGNTAVEPDARRRRLYAVVFDLFEDIAGVKVTERYATRSAPLRSRDSPATDKARPEAGAEGGP